MINNGDGENSLPTLLWNFSQTKITLAMHSGKLIVLIKNKDANIPPNSQNSYATK